MSEKLLKDFDQCVQCGITRGQSKNSRPDYKRFGKDHMFARKMGRDHGFLLDGIVYNDINLCPVCWPHHIRIDRQKFSLYQQNGISGVVLFLAESYPRSSNEEMLTAQKKQLACIFDTIVRKITYLNGDIKPKFEDDYKRARDLSAEHRDRLFGLIGSSIA